jgi:two-component system, chemotaxis family, chemotaxis protein CheY
MPKTVLVVDDHSDTRFICRELLTHFGYEVREAVNGAGALVEAANTPDLILLDFLMPDCDGLTVLGELRARPNTAATPIVVYTAAASHAGELRAHPLVTRVLLKPLEAKHLLSAVHELIGPPVPEMPA